MRDRLDRIGSDCDQVFASAPVFVRPVSTNLTGRRRLRLRVICELTAFESCTGRIVVKTVRPVKTRSGKRRRVRLGARAFDFDSARAGRGRQ